MNTLYSVKFYAIDGVLVVALKDRQGKVRHFDLDEVHYLDGEFVYASLI